MFIPSPDMQKLFAAHFADERRGAARSTRTRRLPQRLSPRARWRARTD